MINLYQQEIFKLVKQKSSWLFVIALIIQNTLFALISLKYPTHFIPKELFVSDYASLSFMPLLIIVKASTIISMEFEFNTLKILFSKNYSRHKIIVSKWLTMFTYSIFLYTTIMIVSLINKTLFFTNFSLNNQLRNSQQTLGQYWLETNLVNFLTLWLLLSFVLLITIVLRRSTVAILIGVTGYFILSVFSTLMFGMIRYMNILKWNPINFLNFPSQIALPDRIEKLTQLTNIQMIFGSLAYIIIFLALGMFSFSRKELL